MPNIARLYRFLGRDAGFAPPDNLVLRLMEAGSDRVTTHSRSGARGLVSWGAAQGNIQGFATCWATGIVLRGVLFCAGRILATTLGLPTAERGPISGTAPVLAQPTPVGDSDVFHTYGYRFPRRL